MARIDPVFVSHGAPNLVIHQTPAQAFLKRLARDLPRPRAVIVASAHFEASRPSVVADPAPGMIYDFGGFEPELREIVYPAPGDAALARAVADALAGAGFDPAIIARRGYDHGVWVPMTLIYPQADIPVVQISVDPAAGPAHHLALGRALGPFAEDDVLVLGSGALTHNLAELFGRGYRPGDAAPEWVRAFGDWMADALANGRLDDLLAYRRVAPHGADNHPSEEHLMPLFVALGAAGDGVRGLRVHSSEAYGVLMMDVYRFTRALRAAA